VFELIFRRTKNSLGRYMHSHERLLINTDITVIRVINAV